MKKTVSLLLCLLLLAACALPARADALWEEVFDTRGFTLRFAEGSPASLGVLYPEDGGEFGEDIACVYFYYIALPEARFYELLQKARSDAEEEELFGAVCPLATVYTLGSGQDFSAVSELYAAYGYERDGAHAQELARSGEYRFYLYDESVAEPEAVLPAEYAAEYTAVAAELKAALAGADYYAPAAPCSDQVGRQLHFETSDLDGNPVSSEALFAAHSFTMVNLWATWCPPCVGELDELAALHEAYAARGCAVVGILLDGIEPGKAETARELMEQNGVGYAVLLPPEGVDALFPCEAIPCSYFVDQNGVIVRPPVIGARVASYEKGFEELLAGAAATPVENDAGVYRVFAADESDAPIPGVMVQLCSDALCYTAVTDETGCASFALEHGVYTAHILKAPAGFAEDDTAYPLLEGYSDVTITLRAAG